MHPADQGRVHRPVGRAVRPHALDALVHATHAGDQGLRRLGVAEGRREHVAGGVSGPLERLGPVGRAVVDAGHHGRVEDLQRRSPPPRRSRSPTCRSGSPRRRCRARSSRDRQPEQPYISGSSCLPADPDVLVDDRAFGRSSWLSPLVELVRMSSQPYQHQGRTRNNLVSARHVRIGRLHGGSAAAGGRGPGPGADRAPSPGG